MNPGDKLVFTRPWRRTYTIRYVKGSTIYLAGVGSMLDMPVGTLRAMLMVGDVKVKGQANG